MKTVIFIHGTGVREPGYTTTLNIIQRQLKQKMGADRVQVEPCYWGGPCGAELNLGGAAIPTYDTTLSVDDSSDDDEYMLALWSMLYQNPLAELALLAQHKAQPDQDLPPGVEPAGLALDEIVKKLTASGTGLKQPIGTEFADLLEAMGLDCYFDTARADVVGSPAYRDAITWAAEPLADYRNAIARALIAQSLHQMYEETGTIRGLFPIDTKDRDNIIALLVAILGDPDLGIGDWVKAQFEHMIKGIGTNAVARHRGRLSLKVSTFSADILMYQSRPQSIQCFIRDTVRRASKDAQNRGEGGEVILLAHSLGGIAAVDTLIEEPIAAVRQLITVGSQSPLLYELNALSSLPFDRSVKAPPHPLPVHFPTWLNVYDLRDFLSYQANTVFGNRVTDIRVDNGLPFPESHSGYWTNPEFCDAVNEFLEADL